MKLIGTQLEFVYKVIRAYNRPLDAGRSNIEISERVELSKQYTRVVMQVVISILVLVCSFVIIFKFEDSEGMQKMSTGFIGTILGYWIR